jgi:arylesterase/paraoxonase
MKKSFMSKIVFIVGVVAALLYIPYVRVRDTLGVDFVPTALRNDQCRRLTAPGLEGCEAVVLHQTAGLAYLACGNIERRKRWFPATFAVDGKGEPAENESIFTLDLKTNEITKLEMEGELGHELFVHGMDIFPITYTLTAIHVVNHAYDGEYVEIFEHVVGTDVMTHVKSVKSPLFRTLNGIASVGRDAFYTTNAFGAEAPWRRMLELVLPTYNSDVVYWNGETATVAHTGFWNTNGAVASQDGTLLFVAETMTRRITVFERNINDGNLTLLKKVDLAYPIDNLARDADGVIYATAFPSLFELFAFAEHKRDKASASLLRLNYDVDKDIYKVDTFFEDDGTHASGTTHIAVDSQRHLLVVGLFHGHAITVCAYTP